MCHEKREINLKTKKKTCSEQKLSLTTSIMSFTIPGKRHAHVSRSDQLQGYRHKQTKRTARVN